MLFTIFSSCSDTELELQSPSADDITEMNTEAKMQQFLNTAYLSMSSTNNYGTDVLAFGDILSDHLFVVNNRYQFAANLNYNSINNDFGFYGSMYDIIMACNMVINNTSVTENANTKRIKAEAKILRGFAYFTLVSYYAPAPKSGVNQEYGVPIVLGNYDSSIMPARSTVAEVYDQVISDLVAGEADALDVAKNENKLTLTKTAAKLLLSRVYLTRNMAGDAQLALQYATAITQNSNPAVFAPVSTTSLNYQNYFAGNADAVSENQPETIWELDINFDTNRYNGIGSNQSLPGLYYRADPNRSLMFTLNFYNSFPTTDIRRGTGPNGLLTTTGGGTPLAGVWTNKYPRLTERGVFMRNLKILRFAEAQLNRIEALYLTGQNALALTELNVFAASRKGSVYTGTNLLEDILKERQKEFYGEGQRFLDLKRHNLPLVKTSNCTANCDVPGGDKLFVLPVAQTALNNNPNLKQYPGY